MRTHINVMPAVFTLSTTALIVLTKIDNILVNNLAYSIQVLKYPMKKNHDPSSAWR